MNHFDFLHAAGLESMSGKDISPIFFKGVNLKLHAIIMAKRHLQ